MDGQQNEQVQRIPGKSELMKQQISPKKLEQEDLDSSQDCIQKGTEIEKRQQKDEIIQDLKQPIEVELQKNNHNNNKSEQPKSNNNNKQLEIVKKQIDIVIESKDTSDNDKQGRRFSELDSPQKQTDDNDFPTNTSKFNKLTQLRKKKKNLKSSMKRHRSLEDLNKYKRKNDSEATSTNSSSNEEENEKNKNDSDATDGIFYSDKETISYKSDMYMKIKNQTSDFEEDLIREIADEEKKSKYNNEIIEENDEEMEASFDDEEEETEQQQLVPKLSPKKENTNFSNNNKRQSKLYKEEYGQRNNQNDDDEDDDDDQDFSRKQKISETSHKLQKQQEKRKQEIEKRKLEKLKQKQQKVEKKLIEKQKKKSEKKKKPFNWSAYKRLLAYTKDEWFLVCKAFISMSILSLSQIFVPRMCGDLLDATIINKDMVLLKELAGKAFVLFSIHGIAETCRTYYYHLLGEKIIIYLRNDCFKKFITNDIEFHDRQQSGELISRMTNDIATAKAAASGNVGNFFRHIFISIGYVGVLVYTSWKLSIVILVCVPIFIVSSNYYGKFTKKMVKKYQKVVSKSTQLAGECFINIRTVKAFSNEDFEINRFKGKQQKGFNLGKEKSVSLALHNGMESALSNAARLAVLFYGGYLVIQEEQLTSGQLASFILYTNSLASSASSITSCMQKIYTATGACQRLFQLMDYKPSIEYIGGKELKNFNGQIEFKNVTFTYPQTDVKTLDNFNLTINVGEQIAFVGSSGSGKSTIIRLLERFYDVQEGSILIDGINIKELNISSFRQHVGYVNQEPILFSGTIEDNLTYGVGQEYTEDELDQATQQACAYDFIHDESLFPKGYRTQVGEQGVMLSGGQKQRIAIARALLKKPKILIFDEATSALDAESEFQVQSAIDNLMKVSNMTIIVIAHRLSTIVNCETIVVLNQGKVQNFGTHYELLETSEAYKSLIERQLNPLQQ